MIKRIFSTAMLWIIVGAVLWYFRTSGAVLLTGVLAVLTLGEFYGLLSAAGWAPFGRIGAVIGGFVTIAPWLQARYGLPFQHLLALAAVLLALGVIFRRDAARRVEALAATLFGLVYVGLLLQYFVRILLIEPVQPARGLILFLWVIAVAKFCDVGALLTGLAWGRHKMCPEISPKKSWEGAVGGVLVAMAVGALIAWLGRNHIGLSPLHAALVALPVAVAAIFSDLIESIIKRRADRKDSGALIPGIGGIFDVSDSLILAAPVGYLLLRFVL